MKKKNEIDELPELDKRIKAILDLNENNKKDKTKMLFFIMYDIEDNKVRREISKYLIKKSCVRVQKSIFLASAKHDLFQEIFKTLKEVQEFYENHDSIFLVPVSTDEIRTMKIIGQSVDFDIITGNKNTLIF